MPENKENASYYDLQRATAKVTESLCMIHNPREDGCGTGFKYASKEKTGEGLIITASHVVHDPRRYEEPAPKITVAFSENKQYLAERYITSPILDIALYKINSFEETIEDLPITEDVGEPGLPIAASGLIFETREKKGPNKFKVIDNYVSVVSGIISAKLPHPEVEGAIIYQLDCTLYKGMSGGPVYTYLKGEPLVGGVIIRGEPYRAGEILHPISYIVSLKYLHAEMLKRGVKTRKLKYD